MGGGEVAEVVVGAGQVLADTLGCGAEELGEDLGGGCGCGVPGCGVGGVCGAAFPDRELRTAGGLSPWFGFSSTTRDPRTGRTSGTVTARGTATREPATAGRMERADR